MTVRRTATLAVLGGALALPLLAPAAASAAPAAPAAPAASRPVVTDDNTKGCPTGTLPAEVKGRPVVKAGMPAVQQVWHGAGGWHLRVTKEQNGRTNRLIFSGTISATAPIHYRGRHLEKGDKVLLSSDRKTLSFRFYNVGYIDGLDFTTDCASSVTFNLQTGAGQTPLDHIALGKDGVHPTSNAFTVTRTPRPGSAPAPVA